MPDNQEPNPVDAALAEAVARELQTAAVPGTEAKRTVIPSTSAARGQITADHPYYPLLQILYKAFDQSAHGKGRERHASSPVGDRNWLDQPILSLNRMVGPGGAVYQIMKKAQEAMGMVQRGEHDAAMAELLGCIIYAAAAHRIVDEMKGGGQRRLPV